MKLRMSVAFFVFLAPLSFFSGLRVLAREPSVFGPEPIKRGTWIVCPSGAAVNYEKGFSGLGVNSTHFVGRHNGRHYVNEHDAKHSSFYDRRWITYGSHEAHPTSKVEVEVLIGTSVNRYTRNQINAILDRLLVAPSNITTSYKSFRVFDNPPPSGSYLRFGRGRTVQLKNSSGKIIKIEAEGGIGSGSLTDASGQKISFTNLHMSPNYSQGYKRGAMYCSSSRDSIRLRLLELLPLVATTDFGEAKKLPLVIMISDLYLVASKPDEGIQIDF